MQFFGQNPEKKILPKNTRAKMPHLKPNPEWTNRNGNRKKQASSSSSLFDYLTVCVQCSVVESNTEVNC